MILGHLGNEKSTWTDPYYVGGLLYPDLFLVAPHVPYATTHYLGVLSTRALQMTASVHGEHVARFAAGIIKHLRDDRRLPLLANWAEPSARPICAQIRELLTLGGLAHQTTLVELATLPAVVEGIIEFALMHRMAANPLGAMFFDTVYGDPSVVQFIVHEWLLDTATVRHANTRWSKELLALSRCTPAELVRTEMHALWPKLACSHLHGAGLLTTRESILARRQLESGLEQVLESMQRSSQTLNQWPAFERFLGLPIATASNKPRLSLSSTG